MARSDLLLEIIKAGITGDKSLLRKAVSAVAAEERSKQHKVLAERLEALIKELSDENTYKNGRSLDNNKVFSLIHEITPEKKFSDLVLPNDVSSICSELIEEHHRSDLLRSYNLEPRNRILLLGPPGNGKTSLAEAIAEALMLPLLVVRYENVIGSYLGETADRLRNLVDYARARRCVLFFDEFETLGKERGDMQETGEIKRVVSSLLMQIDSLPNYVLVVAATNHPELLDRAVWRRFQVKLELPQPSANGLIKWFKQYEKHIEISLGYTFDTLSKQLNGYNFAEIEEFGRSIYRQYVLDQPNADMKKIVSSVLKQYKARFAKI